jgi:Cysteine-rich CPCC
VGHLRAATALKARAAAPPGAIASVRLSVVEGRFACPCCGHLRLDEPPPGTYDIRKECGWEDDYVQFHDLTYRGGANTESLREARENYVRYGWHAAPPSPTPKSRSELPRVDEAG